MLARGRLLARPRLLRPPVILRSPSVQQRALWGLGEIIGVLTAPGQTLQQLSDVRKELQAAKAEMEEAKERDRLPPKKTFVQTQNYFPRKKEEDTLRRILEGPPELTVLFGATSVGKTAMLRHILTSSRYFVLPFDLRIPGFADGVSLYFALSAQFEQYFLQLGESLDGYKEECENIAFSFKHQRLDVTRRVENDGRSVGPSDLAEMLGLLQNALVRYWAFQPRVEGEEGKAGGKDGGEDRKGKVVKERPPKPVPVWLIDEAHKLPDLVGGEEEYLKALMDTMVVLTKQERLCHVIQCTSVSLYMQILIDLNVASHTKFVHIGDPDKETTMDYVRHQLLPSYPQYQQTEVLNNFDDIYDVIGGKLLHWEDGIREWVNEGIPITQSSHVSQAYILLNNFLQPLLLEPKSKSHLASTFKLFERLLMGPVPYYEALQEPGAGVVATLLSERLVEIRWDGRTGNEPKMISVVEGDVRPPLLVPMTPAIRWAMRRVLRKTRGKSD